MLGIGRYGSGAYTACALARRGHRVLLVDSEPLARFDHSLMQMARGCEVDLVTGGNPDWVMEGAQVLFVAPSIDPGHPYVRQAREAGIPVRIDIELLLEQTRAPVFFVTGSNGKTTTAAWLHHALRKIHDGALLAGNVGVPAAKVLLSQDEVKDPLVLEVSSFQGRYLVANATGPDFLVVTNFSPNHLDHHPTIEDYRQSKKGLVPLARRAVVLNTDDREVAAWGAEAAVPLIAFGTGAVSSPGLVVEGGTIVWDAGEGRKQVIASVSDVSLPGQHNLLNFMAAAAAALAAGLPVDAVRKAAGDFEGVPHRLELVAEIAGVSFYDDSASTCPESTLAALETFGGRLVVIVGGRNKGFDLEAFARELQKAARVVLIGETSGTLLGLLQKNTVAAELMADAVSTAWREAKSLGGLPVVLSPGFASFDMFDDYRQRGEIFHQEVRRLPVR